MRDIHQSIQYLEETFYFSWTPVQLLEFYIEQFRSKPDAVLNLDYALMEMYSLSPNDDQSERSVQMLTRGVNETKQIGLKFLNHLELLGCFSQEKLGYCFAKELDTDTFLLWRPDASDLP